MKRSPFHISSWVFSALTLSVVGLTPLCAGGAQEIGGATRSDTAVPMALGDDRINLQSLIEEMSARSPEIKAARQRWEAAKAVVPQVQTLPDPRLQFGYQRMPMAEPFRARCMDSARRFRFPAS